MKVCVVCRSVGTVVAGGIETYVREVYSRISEEENVTVITGKYGKEVGLFTEFKKEVKTITYPFLSRHNPLSRIFTWFGIPIYDDEVEAITLIPFVFIHLLRNHYDAVVVNSPLFVPLVKFLRQKCVFVNHGSIGEKRYFFMRTFRPDNAISCSEFIRKDLLDKFNIDSKVIHHGVNLEEFGDGDSGIRKRYAINKNDVLILGVGRFVPWKHFDILIKILPKLPEKTKLMLIGEGIEKENLVKLVDELGLEERVIFAGTVDRISPYFAASDVFALMSKGEAFGVVYVEAMAAGKPIITYRMGAAPEIVDESFALLLEDGDSVDTMAKKVAAFLKRDLKKMGVLARKRAKDFAWDIAAKKTLKAMRTL